MCVLISQHLAYFSATLTYHSENINKNFTRNLINKQHEEPLSA